MIGLIRLVCFALLFVVPGQKSAPTRVIASNADWKITAQEFENIVASFPAKDQPRFQVSANRRGLLDELIRIWVLTTEAQKSGTAVGSPYKERMAYYTQFAQQISSTISEDDVRSFYEKHRDEFLTIRISQILILNGGSPVVPFGEANTPRLPYDQALKQAQEIRSKLKRGENFEALAKTYSQDSVTAPKGGDVGYISRGQFDRDMEAAAFSLKVGEPSDVIGTLFGFHIIKVTDRKVTPLEQLRDPIRQKLLADEVNRQLEPKVKAAAVKIDEAYFNQ
jgi:hypothetical protein